MKLAILTTQTPHHAHYVRALRDAVDEVVVFRETMSSVKPAFETAHSFEAAREQYEWNRWFDGRQTDLSALAPTHDVSSMNDAEAVSRLADCGADLTIAFGVGLLRAPLIESCSAPLLNLHGGDPQEYRGLDTHLWAIYHRDFAGLVTTLHRLEVGLDTGAIVADSPIPLAPQMPLHSLRAENTEVCVALSKAAATRVAAGAEISVRPQTRKGRYYSSMPAVLKSVCLAQFDAHIRKLPAHA